MNAAPAPAPEVIPGQPLTQRVRLLGAGGAGGSGAQLAHLISEKLLQPVVDLPQLAGPLLVLAELIGGQIALLTGSARQNPIAAGAGISPSLPQLL